MHACSIAAAALATAGILCAGQDPEAPSAKQVADAGTMFRTGCLSCHIPPDPAFAVDRAWLKQVSDTA